MLKKIVALTAVLVTIPDKISKRVLAMKNRFMGAIGGIGIVLVSAPIAFILTILLVLF